MTRNAVADRLELQVLHRDGVFTTGLCECVLSGDNKNSNPSFGVASFWTTQILK
jgi:hypothetical protein